MPGKLTEEYRNKNPEILFDLTPEDDKDLRESDLLDLVNFGQVSEPVTLLGHTGRKYTVEMSLLWDEDYVDILKKTMSYAGDPLLRTRILRRLKLHRAIQRIDDHDYSDVTDMAAQRELWLILCRMSDIQIDVFGGHYDSLEQERNLKVAQSLEELGSTLDSTTPEQYRPNKPIPDNVSDTSIDVGNDEKTLAPRLDDHETIMKMQRDEMEKTEKTLAKHGLGNQLNMQPVISKPQSNDK